MPLLRRPYITPQARRKIRELEQLIKYDFNDKHLACLAIQVVRKRWRGGNRGLAIQGDNLVYVVLCQGWLPSEGMDGYGGAAWHSLRTNYASDIRFARSVKGRLEQCLVCGRIGGMQQLNMEMLGTAMEAIIAAVYEDCHKSMEQVEEVAIALGILPRAHVRTNKVVRWAEEKIQEKLLDLEEAYDEGVERSGSLAQEVADQVNGERKKEMLMTNVQVLARLSFGGTGTGSEQKRGSKHDGSGRKGARNDQDLLGEVDDTFSIMEGPVWDAVDTPGDLLGLLSDTRSLSATVPVLAFSRPKST